MLWVAIEASTSLPASQEISNRWSGVSTTRTRTRLCWRRSTRPSRSCLGSRGRTRRITAHWVQMPTRATMGWIGRNGTCGVLSRPILCPPAHGPRSRRSNPSVVIGIYGGKRRTARKWYACALPLCAHMGLTPASDTARKHRGGERCKHSGKRPSCKHPKLVYGTVLTRETTITRWMDFENALLL